MWTSPALATLQRGHALLHRQHPRLPGARGCSLWQDDTCHRWLDALPPCAPRDGQGSQWVAAWEHPRDKQSCHSITQCRDMGAGTLSPMLRLSRCHQTHRMELPAACCLHVPHRCLRDLPWPTRRDVNPVPGTQPPPFLPCAMELLPSPARNTLLRPALPFLPSNASVPHWRPGDTLGSSVPSPGPDLPSCAALRRSGQKTSPNHWWGGMNALASSQARVISTIPPHSHPPGPLKASPTSISPPATWLQASKSPPSPLSPVAPPDPATCRWPGRCHLAQRLARIWGQEPSRAGGLLPGMGRLYLHLCPPSEGAHSPAKQPGTAFPSHWAERCLFPSSGGCTGR